MRRLSPKELKKDTLTDQVRKSLKLKKLITDNKQDYDTLKASLDPRKQKLQKEFNAFVTSIQVKKSTLLGEVQELEHRRAQALEPLDAKWLELETREITVSDRESVVSNTLHQIELQKEELREQSDIVADKLDELAERELAIVNKEQTALTQQDFLTTSTLELNKKWEAFHQEANIKNEALLDHQKRNLDKEQALDVIKQSLDNRETDLNNYKIQLDDRAATLDRGFQELRNKNGRPS